MADINSITNAAQYKGNPELGGEIGVGLTIDPSPLQRLATYTFYRDRDLWEKKKVDDAAAANQIAAIAAYDINSPLKPYTDDLLNKKEKIKNFLRERPNALRIDKDKEGFQTLHEMMGDFEIARKRATANDALYNAEKARVERLPAGEARDAGFALLEDNAKDLFSGGINSAYGKQIRTSPELNPNDYKLPAIPDTEVYTITRNANDTVIDGKAYADLDRLDALADGTYFRINEGRLNTESDAFKALSPDEQKRQKLEAAVTDKKVIALDNTAKGIDALVREVKAKFVDAQGQPMSLDDIPESELSKAGGTVGNYIKSVKQYNKQVDELNAIAGKNYSHINLDNGATPQELLKLEFFNNHGSSLFKQLKPTVQQTDNSLQGGQLAETIRHNKATEGINKGELKLKEDQWKTATTGGETVKSAAWGKANRIYTDLKKLAGPDGVIPPDKLRKLNIEQRKYLGIEQVETSDQGVPRSIFKPLDITDNDAIQLINGEIRVMKPKDGETKVLKFTRPDGTIGYTGLWDQSRSTNVPNIATNIVNEQLKTAGGKELNQYLLPPDVQAAPVTVNNIGGRTVTSGGGGSYLIKGTTYSEPDLIKMGYTLDEIKKYKQ